MNYNLNITQLIADYLPPVLRLPVRKAWLETLLKPLYSLQTAFLAFITQMRYESSLTGQTTILEMYLNNLFDNTNRRIFIEETAITGDFWYFEAENQADDFLYFEAENQADTYLQFENEDLPASFARFTVNVPAVLGIPEAQIRANVDKYKIAGVSYLVVFF